LTVISRSEPFRSQQGVDEIDEQSDRERARDPAFERHGYSFVARSTSVPRPRRSHAATNRSIRRKKRIVPIT